MPWVRCLFCFWRQKTLRIKKERLPVFFESYHCRMTRNSNVNQNARSSCNYKTCLLFSRKQTVVSVVKASFISRVNRTMECTGESFFSSFKARLQLFMLKFYGMLSEPRSGVKTSRRRESFNEFKIT